ncbi:uncharacterized protein LOC113004523 isoform X2 [Solenopsis invicta]|uniref:uncharacterized protein LOC113004523 isoform X2 n=1 Tax=Solenopsis invicta TaxID=13686 RepID=UPI00193D7196|nr:uncharacterized protein LOC113004523 isoform X2 [Solenopsis invicta]
MPSSPFAENKFVHYIKLQKKNEKMLPCRSAEKKGKWDYIKQNLPYVLLTDVMNMRYSNNTTKACNTDAIFSRSEAVEDIGRTDKDIEYSFDKGNELQEKFNRHQNNERTDDESIEYSFDVNNNQNCNDHHQNYDMFDENTYSHASENVHNIHVAEHSGSEYSPSEHSSILSETDANDALLSDTINERNRSSESKKSFKKFFWFRNI